jgi:hypothetical protein
MVILDHGGWVTESFPIGLFQTGTSPVHPLHFRQLSSMNKDGHL